MRRYRAGDRVLIWVPYHDGDPDVEPGVQRLWERLAGVVNRVDARDGVLVAVVGVQGLFCCGCGRYPNVACYLDEDFRHRTCRRR